MKKLLGSLATIAMILGLTTVLGAPAEAVSWTMKSPFAREIVRYGDTDVDAYRIEHVYEVQYRLRWLGLLDAAPNGHFGPKTRAAVLKFQKRNHLRQTGTVNYQTWQPLIKQTIRRKRAVPKVCKSAGWHACYDRKQHQVNLYRNGTMLNSWLVRGGAYDMQTRVGDFTVFRRAVDHKSRTYGGAPMPYSQFFSGGQALHGSRFMLDPFEGHSHGCVNMYVKDAQQLWDLTASRRLSVHVYGAWS